MYFDQIGILQRKVSVKSNDFTNKLDSPEKTEQEEQLWVID